MKTYTIADIPLKSPGPERPYRIFAACLDRTIGDFATRAYYLATIKANRDGPTDLTAYWIDDRGYKAPIMRMAPQIDRHAIARDGDILPLDAFYDTGDRRPIPDNEVSRIVAREHARSDLILTPSMMPVGNLRRFARFPKFSIPAKEAEGLMRRLQERGLSMGRWHATIFYRRPNYRYRGPTPYRDIQDESRWLDLAQYIVRMGGQVIRIGHPGMAEWPAQNGFVDLSRAEDIMLHAYAVYMSRFCIVTPSGPALFPAAFDVPFALANAVSDLGCFRPDTILLPRPIYRPDGNPVDIDQLRNHGLWTDEVVRDMTANAGHSVGDNSAEELKELARMLYDRTKS